MNRRRLPPRSAQRGVALLIVLWACTMLAIMLGGYAALARTEGLQARNQFAQTQAQYDAEAGLAQAIYHLQDPLPQQRWIADGRSYALPYNGATLDVSAVDENGKVDVNAATPQVLQAFFKAAGMRDEDATVLAAHVVAWRSYTGEAGVDSEDAKYTAAGLDYGPRHGPFASIEELRMVLGMPPAIYAAIANEVTVWSGRAAPDPTTAPALALAAIPGMTPESIRQTQAARLNRQPLGGVTGPGGVTHSIRSEAILADGTSAVVRATIRLRGTGAGSQPYAVLRWQEGNGE